MRLSDLRIGTKRRCVEMDSWFYESNDGSQEGEMRQSVLWLEKEIDRDRGSEGERERKKGRVEHSSPFRQEQ